MNEIDKVNEEKKGMGKRERGERKRKKKQGKGKKGKSRAWDGTGGRVADRNGTQKGGGRGRMRVFVTEIS